MRGRRTDKHGGLAHSKKRPNHGATGRINAHRRSSPDSQPHQQVFTFSVAVAVAVAILVYCLLCVQGRISVSAFLVTSFSIAGANAAFTLLRFVQ